MDKRTTGLYNKFTVTRNDGKSEPCQKHDGCEYFVLDVTHDKHAYAALKAYAHSCGPEFPALANDVRMIAQLMTIGPSEFFGKREDAIVDQALIDRVTAIGSGTDSSHAERTVEWARAQREKALFDLGWNAAKAAIIWGCSTESVREEYDKALARFLEPR